MRRFGCLTFCFLVACSTNPSQSKFSCQAGYACLTISVKAPRIEQSSLQSFKENSDVALVNGIISLASEETERVRGFGFYEQGHLNLLHADTLWSYSQGEGITVAVIDSGVDTQHEALKARVVQGYDFIKHSHHMTDPHGHGTAVAAIIAGDGKLKGLAPKATILPLRVLDEHSQGSASDVTRAILYAADLLPDLHNPYPAQVINLSLGGDGPMSAMYEAIKLVRQKGVVVVAAAGNSGHSIAYPAAYAEVIGVGAAYVSLGNWKREAYSGYGQGLDVLAPVGGVTETNWGWFREAGVRSALANSSDQSMNFYGTSAAAPQVAGLAALLLSMGKIASEIEAIVQHSSLDLSLSGWDSQTGYGLINPVAALRAASLKGTNSVQIQILDMGSQQEVMFGQSDGSHDITLSGGDYTLLVWVDHNQDHLWQQGEPCARQDTVLRPDDDLKLNLELSFDCAFIGERK